MNIAGDSGNTFYLQGKVPHDNLPCQLHIWVGSFLLMSPHDILSQKMITLMLERKDSGLIQPDNLMLQGLGHGFGTAVHM